MTVIISKNLCCQIIEILREMPDLDSLTDELQFGVDGKDEFDGHRCRICEKLCGGDSSHKCWQPARFKIRGSMTIGELAKKAEETRAKEDKLEERYPLSIMNTSAYCWHAGPPCNCDCHKSISPQKIHFMPCCSPCKKCGVREKI